MTAERNIFFSRHATFGDVFKKQHRLHAVDDPHAPGAESPGHIFARDLCDLFAGAEQGHQGHSALCHNRCQTVIQVLDEHVVPVFHQGFVAVDKADFFDERIGYLIEVCDHLVLFFFRELGLILREEEILHLLHEYLFIERGDGNLNAFGDLADQFTHGLISLLGSLSECHLYGAHDGDVHVCLAADVVEPVREAQHLVYLL